MNKDPFTRHSARPHLHPGEHPSTPSEDAAPVDDRAWDVFLPDEELDPLPDEFADPWWERDEEPFD